jgi:hypothetical protein
MTVTSKFVAIKDSLLSHETHACTFILGCDRMLIHVEMYYLSEPSSVRSNTMERRGLKETVGRMVHRIIHCQRE